jgi:hypothetical protein
MPGLGRLMMFAAVPRPMLYRGGVRSHPRAETVRMRAASSSVLSAAALYR